MSELIYDLDQDANVFRQASLQFADQRIQITACTVQGSKDGIATKPNEDAFSIIIGNNSLVAAVFDGCSSQKPIAWLSDQTGARFASHVLAETLPTLSDYNSTILKRLNKRLAAISIDEHGASPDDVHSMPSTTSTVAHIDIAASELELSHIGDSFCILFHADGSSELVTIDKNQPYDEAVFRLATKIASQQSITPREAMKTAEIRQAISDNFQQSHNRLDGTGQGIMNGSPDAEQYMQSASISLQGIAAVLLGSDGLIPPGWDEHTSAGRAKLLAVLQAGGLAQLIATKQQFENADPDWQNVRFKHSDDATGIYIQLVA